MDVNSTSFERYGRPMDVETTLCVFGMRKDEFTGSIGYG